MEIRQLRTFIQVANCEGFTKAGERLGYTQSTVTNHIRAIEEEVGNRVFDRLGKTVTLTDSGERLLTYAKQIVQLHDEAVRSAQCMETPKGTIRIGANESLMAYRLPTILSEYKKKYPNVHLLLQPSENQSLQQELKEGKFDCALFINPERLNEDIVTIDLIEEELVIVASPNHPLAKGLNIHYHQLKNEVFLLTEPGSYRELLESELDERRIPYHALSFWSIEAIKQSVKAELGLSFLPKMTVCEELSRGELVQLQLACQTFIVHTQLAYHEDKWMTPALESFMHTVTTQAKEWK
ncbi:LysR family transcriptional regulator [Savagea sp. SN6]|uniref:LysR family transcriptional regulator n=1 Tax=Savagea serpentis TaxID=2785297 RepID=A0A8J7G5H5_9BACL|nr:LysR family transcriptional regulator [Savagea serpentis]MBF4501732.1 LysR family transcriptional regulator [Savagea serpentis]